MNAPKHTMPLSTFKRLESRSVSGFDLLRGADIAAESDKQYNRHRERDFVGVFEEKLAELSSGRVLCLSGIRRSGKTVGIWHVIKRLLNSGVSSDAIVYITSKGENSTVSELMQICDGLGGAEYVFIDEATMVTDIISYAKHFSDVLSMRYKIVLSGTQSYVWVQAMRDSLYGRVSLIRVTMPSFAEYLRLFPGRIDSQWRKSDIVRHFCRYNGVLLESEYDGMQESHISLQSSVLGNIVSTVERNRHYSSFDAAAQALYSLGPTELPPIMYKALLNVTQTIGKGFASVSKLKLSDKAVALYREAVPGAYNTPEQADKLRSRMEGIKSEQLSHMLNALIQIDVAYLIRNAADVDDSFAAFGKNSYELCTTLSSLLYSMLATLSRYALAEDLEGVLLENLVLSHIQSTVAAYRGVKMYFFRCTLTDEGLKEFEETNRTPEVDIVVQRVPELLEEGDVKTMLIEVKRNGDHKSAHERNLRSKVVERYLPNIVKRVVV